MKVRMQQPELTSSFLLLQSVWLQRCQGWAFLIVFKITVSPFDDANVGNRGRINHRALCSWSSTQKCEMCKHTHTHRCLNIILFFYLQSWLYHILSFLILPHPHTCNHTHKSTALPVSSLTWCRQKAWIHPRPSPHPSSFFSGIHSTHKHTHTQPANMYYVAFVSVSRSGNEAVLMYSVFCVCLSESCVKCEVFCYGDEKKM